MRAAPLLLVALALVLASAPPPAAAQQAQSCDLREGARGLRRLATPTGVIIFISGPANFDCDGGIHVRADSAVQNVGQGELQLIGRVFYDDMEKTLSADWVNYLERDGRLFARGRVVLTDKDAGSTIRGPQLEYRRGVEGGPESRTLVRGGAEAVLQPRRETPDAADPDADAAEPFHVYSRQMEIIGERFFHATEDVRLVRGSTEAWAQDARFDQTDQRLHLRGDARVEDPEFELTGDEIQAELDGDRLREVAAEPDALLVADELRIRAPLLRIFFEEGEIHRLIGHGAAEALRPTVTSETYLLIADSLDIHAPGQLLDVVYAVGDAFAEELEGAREATAGLPPVLARDWVQGDTIIGHFVPDTVPAEDPAVVASGDTVTVAEQRDGDEHTGTAAPRDGPDRYRVRAVLDRIVAIGSDGAEARAFYRLDEEEPGRPAANYLVALRITLLMKDGEVKEVEADGPLRGIYLEPLRDRRRPDDAPPEGGGTNVADADGRP